MIIGNDKPAAVIGYPQSSLTEEMLHGISQETPCVLIDPVGFLDVQDDHLRDCQYIIGFSKDKELRRAVAKKLSGLDVFSFIHHSAIVENGSSLGRGVFIGPFCYVCQKATIGNHVLAVATYCLVSHYSVVGDFTVLHSDAKIAGRAQIGSGCELNFGSRVGFGVTIGDQVCLGEFSAAHKDITAPGFYVGYPTARRAGDWNPVV